MSFQNLRPSFSFGFKPIVFLSNTAMLGILVMLLCFYGCGTTRNTSYIDLSELHETFQLRDSSTERLPTSVGNCPETDTLFHNSFINLERRIERREPLTLEEYILYAESMNHLFPHKKTEQTIKMLKQIQQMQAARVPVTILKPKD